MTYRSTGSFIKVSKSQRIRDLEAEVSLHDYGVVVPVMGAIGGFLAKLRKSQIFSYLLRTRLDIIRSKKPAEVGLSVYRRRDGGNKNFIFHLNILISFS